MLAAQRLAPVLERLGTRMGGLGALGWKAQSIQPPEPPEAMSVPPQDTSRPSVPISGPQMLTPNERVAGGFDLFGPSSSSAVMASGASPSPLDGAAWPSGPQRPAPPSAPAEALTPRSFAPPAPRAEMSPDVRSPMGFFARNAAMMRDPSSGDFIDPMAARQANATGPDLIQKMMNYLHAKDTA